MAEPFELIVGLGNPGDRYHQTRHNAGFWFVDLVAWKLKGDFRTEKRFFGQLVECEWQERKIRLLKPQTYMNHSGQSVSAITKFFKIPMPQVLVIHDEIDLKPGVLRLKKGGGHGGHNGLRDIISATGSSDFTRLRVGVGHPGLSHEVVDYVLQHPGKAERALIDDTLDLAIQQLDIILQGDIQSAMQVLHTQTK